MLSIYLGHVLDSLRAMPDNHFHCVVTSPPYWAQRDYGLPPSLWGDGWHGCLGLEPDPLQFIAHLVEVFNEVRRVLRPDGTLWLNMGDSYSNVGKHGGKTSGKHLLKKLSGDRAQIPRAKTAAGFIAKPKEMLGMPWRIAFALSAAGWYLRSEIIWNKRNPMPETVYDRPSRTHEHVFLFSKSHKGYFYDFIGASVPASTNSHSRGSGSVQKRATREEGGKNNADFNAKCSGLVATRNMRTVWTLSNESLKEKHFAAYPTALVEHCLRPGLSPRGACSACGAPVRRQYVKERIPTRPGVQTKVARVSQHAESPYQSSTIAGNRDPERHVTHYVTTGWQPRCECRAEAAASRVLDPFLGSGTTAIVAHQFGADTAGCELSADYVAIARRRIQKEFGMFAPEVIVR